MNIIIIGAGPAGLGAALRLKELGITSFSVLEKNNHPGGLCASFRDSHGFTWDLGGHVIFSHFKEFSDAFESALAGQYLTHERVCRIRIFDRWVQYPFQNNISELPQDIAARCLETLKTAPGAGAESANFRDWILNTMGTGISEYFMLPYNFKVWAYPAQLMSKDWIAERVAQVTYDDVLKRFNTKSEDMRWGPNAYFKYPQSGGTGAIFTALAQQVERNVRCNSEVVEIDTENKLVRLSSSETLPYDFIINTSPLDTFVSLLKPFDQQLATAARDLLHNGIYSIGIGINGTLTDKKCWMYFPESNIPAYRVTYLSNYSPENAPNAQTHSMLCEVSFSSHKPEPADTVVQRTILGLMDCGMLNSEDSVISTDLRTVEHAYPIPSLGRDSALNTILPELERLSILSRGRFGAWRYEAGNTDHCYMQGREAADRIISGKEECVWKS